MIQSRFSMDKEFRQSLITTFIILAATAILIATFTLGSILTDKSGAAMRKLMNDHMLSVADLAADMIDGDKFSTLTSYDKGTAAYDEVMSTLEFFRQNIELEYIYTIKEDDNGDFVYVLDPDPEEPAEYGELIEVTDAIIQASKGGSAVNEEATHDKWGSFYSAFSPIYDSEGSVVGMVGVDFNAEWYDAQISSLRNITAVTGFISLLMGAGVIIVITYRSRRSVRIVHSQLNELADNFAELKNELSGQYDDYGQEEEDKQIKQIKRVFYEDDDLDALGVKILNMQESLHEQIMKVREQAYFDVMTGASSKTRYLEDTEHVQELMNENKIRFVVAVFDIVSLKTINDNFGHAAGDRVIKDTGRILVRIFGKENVYRIGGDEFIVGRSSADSKDMEKWLREFDEAVEQKNKEDRHYDEFPLAVSRGFAEYRPGSDLKFNDVFKRADSRMYEDKDAFYRNHPELDRRLGAR